MASTLANRLQPYYNGGLPGYLLQSDFNDMTSNLSSVTFWLNFLSDIQTVKVTEGQIVSATGYRSVYIGGLFWTAFVPTVAFFILMAFVIKRVLTCVCYSKKLKKICHFKSSRLSLSSASSSCSIHGRCKLFKKSNLICMLSITIFFTFCSLMAAMLIFCVSLSNGHKVHESLKVNYERSNVQQQQQQEEIGAAFKTSAGYVQLFLNNGLVELKDNVNQTLTTSTATFEQIVMKQVKVFTTQLLKNYGVTDSFQSADNMFTNFRKVLSAMEAIKQFQDSVLKDLNAFDGGIAVINSAVKSCCASDTFCGSKLSKKADQLSCEATMRNLPLMKMGINAQKLNFDSGASLLSILANFNINVSKLEKEFKTGETQLNQMLQNVFGEVKRNFNLDSIADNILPFLEKAKNASIPFNETLESLKTDGIDSIISVVHDYWYSAFSSISSIHFIALLYAVFVVLYFLWPLLDRFSFLVHQFENESKASSKSPPLIEIKNKYLASAENISQDKCNTSPYDIDFDFLEYGLGSFNSEKSFCTYSTTSFDNSPYATSTATLKCQDTIIMAAHKEIHLRQNSYKMAINQSSDNQPSLYLSKRGESNSPPLAPLPSTICIKSTNVLHSSSKCTKPFTILLLFCAIFTLLPCIFSLVNFYLAASVKTEVCRYLKTDFGVALTDVKLNRFINQTLAPLFAKISTIGDFTLNLHAPKHILRALYDKCSEPNVTLLNQIEMSDLINVDSLMKGKMLAEILEKGRSIAIDKIQNLRVDQLIPASTQTMLSDAKRISGMFIDKVNYNESLMELQKPLILLPIDLAEYLEQLFNISQSIRLERPNDNNAAVLQALVQQLQTEQLLTYQRLKINLQNLQSNFVVLQNTRVITNLIDTLQICLSSSVQILNNASQVVSILNDVYDAVIMQSAVQQIGQSLRVNLNSLEQQLVTCQPLYLAYKSLTETVCDVAIQHLLDYSTLYALSVIFFQISLCLVMLIVMAIKNLHEEEVSQC